MKKKRPPRTGDIIARIYCLKDEMYHYSGDWASFQFLNGIGSDVEVVIYKTRRRKRRTK